MQLTEKEKEICDKYSAYDEDGFDHCNDCPLNLKDNELFIRNVTSRTDNIPVISQGFNDGVLCYKTIDGRLKEVKNLKRYGQSNKNTEKKFKVMWG